MGLSGVTRANSVGLSLILLVLRGTWSEPWRYVACVSAADGLKEHRPGVALEDWLTSVAGLDNHV